MSKTSNNTGKRHTTTSSVRPLKCKTSIARKPADSQKPNEIMKELAELKKLMKTVAENASSDTKIFLPTPTILLVPNTEPKTTQQQNKNKENDVTQ